MKKFHFFLILASIFFTNDLYSQVSKNQLLSKFKKSKSVEEKKKYSFLLAEYFLETDEIDSSQKWLNETKENHLLKEVDTTSFFIKSLQSELFYYNRLFQFGSSEAQKATAVAIQLKDSALIANGYFFEGINNYEKKQFLEAEKSFSNSIKYFPQKKQKAYIRSSIESEHIYNNMAQLKLRINQKDSAIWYNSKAYKFALATNSRRGIPNTEQTFGEIYLSKNDIDSAQYYFKRSIESAKRSDYYDIVLINLGLLSQCNYSKNEIINFYENGNDLITSRPINQAYKKYFYIYILESFKKIGDFETASNIQDKIIELDEATRLKGNKYIQNITEMYSKNENKLLFLEVEKLKSKQRFTFLQIIALSLFALILILIILITRRKNKIQKQLLEQKNEISKDLHDDIGSGLSSILIYSNLIINTDKDSDKLLLAEKINKTGTEISKRLHAFIWSLNTEQNNLHLFSEYVKQYAFQLFDKTAITFYFKNEIDKPEDIKIDGRFRKNLFYIAKEIFNNTLKHSKATKVYFTVSFADKKTLKLQFKDNGIGLTENNPFGNGLKNIEKRIQSINGSVAMNNNKGLTTTLLIKL
ncbi:ATP-binding protein [Flavobacterium capsici]|uniref:histidine kinase n=1 Tax=Flavobacterium capsici TaxID=3075618 RepID=A0AA96EWF9_9FLAO|nr:MULTISPECIES: hypothetical protein [unclassified Flavobacterium]WNM19819.1 hypothetical protein RN608_03850 [Flavobacterium sp. PMR2A8]WNM21208.1 hypothetical protein RN605_11020 [Flavobacterium sp. PMTSA4]